MSSHSNRVFKQDCDGKINIFYFGELIISKRLCEYHSAVGGGKMWELWAESASNLLKVHCRLFWVSNIGECCSMTFLLFHGTGDWKEKTRQTAWRLRFEGGQTQQFVPSFLPRSISGQGILSKIRSMLDYLGQKLGSSCPDILQMFWPKDT